MEDQMETNPAFEIPDSALRELAELDRLARGGVAAVPPPSFIAEFVKLQRAMLGWKQEALASFAGVSLSTIERIERDEAVSVVSLDRVAIAIGQTSGAFTEPRIPLRVEEAVRKAQESLAVFEDRVWVTVRPLRTQPQVSSLARTHLKFVDGDRLGSGYTDDLAALGETIDVLGFALTTERTGWSPQKERLKRRELYMLVLDQVKAIERRAHAVALAGTYKAGTNSAILPVVDVGLIAFFPLLSDPGAIKRRDLLAPTKIDLIEIRQRFCETDN
jgi:transcriptional regulator with XRE-family HTH domain